MQRREFLSMSAAAGLLAQQNRPNVLLIMADDLGSKDMGHLGAEIATPNLDKLAADGMRFSQGYAFPVCSPTRSGLMTGRSPMRLGIMYTVIRPWEEYGLPLEEHIMPQTFRAAGYQTAITGKWHLGHSKKAYLPHNRGFDHAYGHVNGAIDYFTHIRDGGLDWHRNGTSVDEKGYSTDLLAAEATRWIRNRDRARPFFLYVPFNAPHSPLQAPGEMLAKYKSIQDPRRRAFAAMVDRMDAGVGRILGALDEEKIAQDTIVMFLSDNGGPTNLGASNGTLRAAKGTVYEGGIRSPYILRYPGKVRAGSQTRQVMTVQDIFPTLAGAAGVTPRNRLPFDGRNLWPSLAQGKLESREDLFFAVESGRGLHHALRRGDWKLVRNVDTAGKASNELYKLDEDPAESKDVSAANAKLVGDMAAKVDSWRALYPARGTRLSTNAPKGFQGPPKWAEAARA